MSTFFLISVPTKESPKKTIADLEGRIRKTDKDTVISEFDVPFQELKVGNIDALIYLSDALKKTCVTVEATIRKVAQLYLELVMDDEKVPGAAGGGAGTGEKKTEDKEAKKEKADKKITKLLIEVKGTVKGGVPPEVALEKFKWFDDRYPKRKPLGELCNAMKGSIAEVEKELREKTLEYNTICQKIAQMSANESGNLMSRDINTIIKEYNKDKPNNQQFRPVESLLAPETIQMINDFNSTSGQKLQPFLTTLYVVVPKNEQKAWKTNYEGLLDEMNVEQEKKAKEAKEKGEGEPDEVKEEKKDEKAEKTEKKEKKKKDDSPHFLVPRSSVLLAQDNDSCLNSIIVFTKDIEEFKSACRARRYTVRRNDPTTVINEEEKQTLKKAQENKKKILIRWAQTSFGDAFMGWLHLKCIQCFVESILRYGLPPECVAMLVQPKKGGEKKLVKQLCEHYQHLGGQFNDAEDDAIITTEEKNSGSGDKFFPFIYLEIDLSFIH